MKKWAALFLSAALLWMCSCVLAEYSPGCLSQPPQEVLEHLKRNFARYALEDYCEVENTPAGDYGFAMLTNGDERLLVGYEDKHGKMTYWLKSHSAVMQGGEEAWFSVREKGGEYIDLETNQLDVADGLTFSITQLDDAGESYEKWIAYHWEDGGFKLSGYKDWDHFYGNVEVENGALRFTNWLEGWDFGRVQGTIQRDIRYVNFANLPKTVGEAKTKLSDAPELKYDVLYSVPNIFVQDIQFTGGRKYPVYQGPGEEYGRAANGKASVSTNDWIQVFCRYNGYAMIQYDISADQFRIGWIDEEALPSGAKVEEINLGLEREDETTIAYACALTDDPYNSGNQIAWLEADTPVLEVIYNLYGWSYVRVTVEGKTICGFVPSDAPVHG